MPPELVSCSNSPHTQVQSRRRAAPGSAAWMPVQTSACSAPPAPAGARPAARDPQTPRSRFPADRCPAGRESSKYGQGTPSSLAEEGETVRAEWQGGPQARPAMGCQPCRLTSPPNARSLQVSSSVSPGWGGLVGAGRMAAAAAAEVVPGRAWPAIHASRAHMYHLWRCAPCKRPERVPAGGRQRCLATCKLPAIANDYWVADVIYRHVHTVDWLLHAIHQAPASSADCLWDGELLGTACC